MKCTKCNNDTGATWKTLCIACWKNRDVEEIRAYRQNKIDKKVARLNSQAGRLETEADKKQSAFNKARKDWAWVSQPGYIPGREKILSRFEKGMQLNHEASEIRQKADWMERRGAVVKGDAERLRQAKREQNDKVISKGQRVFDPAAGEGTVLKVNKKTYTIKFDKGFTWNQDKSWVRVI